MFSALGLVVGNAGYLLNRKSIQQRSWHLCSYISAKALQHSLLQIQDLLQSEALRNLALLLVLPTEDKVSSSCKHYSGIQEH